MASAEKWVLETAGLQSEKDSWSKPHSGTEQFTSIPLSAAFEMGILGNAWPAQA